MQKRLRRALTLVELVVVLAILSISASIVIVRLAGPLRRARVDTAIEQWLNADHYARTLSRTRSIALRITQTDAGGLELYDAAGERLRRWSFAPTIRVRCESLAAEELSEIPFPQSSGSIDYRVRFADGQAEKTMWVAGATGHANLDGTSPGRDVQ